MLCYEPIGWNTTPTSSKIIAGSYVFPCTVIFTHIARMLITATWLIDAMVCLVSYLLAIYICGVCWALSDINGFPLCFDRIFLLSGVDL